MDQSLPENRTGYEIWGGERRGRDWAQRIRSWAELAEAIRSVVLAIVKDAIGQ